MVDRSYLILHGLEGSGPGHWQTWLAARLRADNERVAYPDLPDAEMPSLHSWRERLQGELEALPEGETVIVCHSLSCLLWLHHVADGTSAPRPARVALVAPPSPRSTVPELADFLPVALLIDELRRAADGTVLACGTDDPYCPEGAQVAYGLPLRLPTTVVPGGGHLNVAAGYGPWPAMLDWCGRDKLAFLV